MKALKSFCSFAALGLAASLTGCSDSHQDMPMGHGYFTRRVYDLLNVDSVGIDIYRKIQGKDRFLWAGLSVTYYGRAFLPDDGLVISVFGPKHDVNLIVATKDGKVALLDQAFFKRMGIREFDQLTDQTNRIVLSSHTISGLRTNINCSPQLFVEYADMVFKNGKLGIYRNAKYYYLEH